jgi:hypothetical protein
VLGFLLDCISKPIDDIWLQSWNDQFQIASYPWILDPAHILVGAKDTILSIQLPSLTFLSLDIRYPIDNEPCGVWDHFE